MPIPERREQVPEWWRTFFPWPVSSFLYGLGLGIGFLTFLRHGTLGGGRRGRDRDRRSLARAVAIVAPFGLARACTVAVAGRGHDAERIRAAGASAWSAPAAARRSALANWLVLLAVAALASAWAVPPGAACRMAPARRRSGGVFAWAAAGQARSPRALARRTGGATASRAGSGPAPSS